MFPLAVEAVSAAAPYFLGFTFNALGYDAVLLTDLLIFAIATAALIAVSQRLAIRDRP